MSTLRDKVIKLAHKNPELRKHLVPLLKSAGGGIYQIFFNIFKEAFKESCTKLYTQFYRDYRWEDIEGVSSSIQPGLWQVVSKYSPMVAVSYHVTGTKLTITCSLLNLHHSLSKMEKVIPLGEFLARDMTEKDMQILIMKFIISCAKRVWR